MGFHRFGLSVLLSTVLALQAAGQYCAASITFPCGGGEFASHFTFEAINDSYPCGGYEDRTAQFATLTTGVPQPVSVTVSNWFSNILLPILVSVYVDWNGDGDFIDASEGVALALDPGTGTTRTYSGTITAPPGSALTTRLRLRANVTPNYPCGSSLSGSVKDYTVNIRPANDLCADATPITSGSTPGTNLYATLSGGALAPCGGVAKDVWYTYTATCTASVLVSLCPSDGGAASFDSVLRVFSGPCSNLVLVACDDNGCGTRSRLTVGATAGQVYRINVAAASGSPGGTFTLVTAVQAATQAFGVSCGTPAPTLSSTLPLLGTTGTVTLANSTPGAIGFLFTGNAAPPVVLPGGCSLVLQNPPLTLFNVITTDATGTWTFSTPIANDPSLACLVADFQAFVLQSTGLASTNGLHVVLGY